MPTSRSPSGAITRSENGRSSSCLSDVGRVVQGLDRRQRAGDAPTLGGDDADQGERQGEGAEDQEPAPEQE